MITVGLMRRTVLEFVERPS